MAPHLRTGAERLGSGCRQRARMDVPLAAAARAAAWLLLLSQLPGAEAFARKRMPQQLPGDVNAVQQVLAAAGVADAKVLQRFADEEMDMTALYWCSRQTLKELGVTKKGQQIRLKVEIDDYVARDPRHLARESRQGVSSSIMHYVHAQASSAFSRVRQAPEVHTPCPCCRSVYETRPPPVLERECGGATTRLHQMKLKAYDSLRD